MTPQTKAVQTSGFIILIASFIAFVLNTMVLSIFIAKRKRVKPYMLFILNLLASDLGLAFFGVISRGPGLIWSDYFAQSTASMNLCLLTGPVVTIFACASSAGIVLITLDRWYAICHPLRHRSVLTRFTVVVLISLLWVLYTMWILAVVLLLHYDVISNIYVESFGRCSFTGGQAGQNLVVITYGLFFILPFFITTSLYIPILSTMIHDSKMIGRHNGKGTDTRAKKRQKKRIRKAFIFISSLVLLFFVSWFPHVTNVYLATFFNVKAPTSISLGCVVLFYTNLVSDPIIYALNCPLIRLPFQSVSEIKLGSTNNAELKGSDRKTLEGDATINIIDKTVVINPSSQIDVEI